MDDDEYDEFEDDDEEFRPMPAHKARVIDFAIAFLSAVLNFTSDVRMIAMSHANWKNEQQRAVLAAEEPAESDDVDQMIAEIERGM